MVAHTSAVDDKPKLARPDYQTALRVLGAIVDESGATAVRLIELVDGFSVQYQPREGDGRPIALQLRYDELRSPHTHYLRHRFLRHGRTTGLLSTYEDVFRALGYELDEVQAQTVLIEELDDGLLLTYQYLNPVDGYMLRE